MAGEFESGPGVPLQGIKKRAGWPGRKRPDRDPHGIALPFEAFRILVATIRFTAPATPFQRPRGFPEDPYPTPGCRELPWTWASLLGAPIRSRRSPARLQRPSWGSSPLQRRRFGGLLDPGFQPRHVPPSGFFTLLTVSSLRTSRPRGPVPFMGFTLQSFSLSQSRTPFDACALLPFLTSHPSALRTRRSRCPATPGLCSPQETVP
jgi:hypothetical protein